jgi:hypothetical protein
MLFISPITEWGVWGGPFAGPWESVGRPAQGGVDDPVRGEADDVSSASPRI